MMSGLAVSSPALAGGSDFAAGGSSWVTGGHDPAGSRNQPFEHQISPRNVGRLSRMGRDDDR